MVCGLVAIFFAVTVEVHVEAVLVLGVSTHGAPKVSVDSDELNPAVPSGLNDGLYSSASDAGVAAAVKPTTSTSPSLRRVATRTLSDCCRIPVASNLSPSAS